MLKGPEIFKDCHMRLHILPRNLYKPHIHVDVATPHCEDTEPKIRNWKSGNRV